MRILQLIQKKQLRGAEVFACQLSNHLMDLGHEVRVVSLEDGDAELPFRGTVTSLSVHVDRRFLDVAGWKKIRDTVRSFQPDIVQANAGDTLKYAVFSKLFFRWKARLVFRNASISSLYIRSAFSRWFNGALFSRVDYIASVSAASRADLVRLFPSLAPRSEAIPIGIERKPYSAVPRLEGRVYLVHVGGFTYEKNHEGLIRIFAAARKHRPELVLWLVGDGPRREKITQLVEDLGLGDSVVFWGSRANALDYVHTADALVLTSLIEGLPAVILEAFYTRTPALSYAVGGVGELITDRVTGSLMARDDEAGFMARVLDLVNHPGVYRAMTDAAYTFVMEAHDNATIARRFAGLYERIIKNG